MATAPYDPADHTVDEVLDYVDAHPAEADAVLAAEQAGKNRVTLVNQLEGGDEPEVSPAVITTKTKDYLGRTLVNIATNAKDHLGRGTQVGDLDYLGRALVA